MGLSISKKTYLYLISNYKICSLSSFARNVIFRIFFLFYRIKFIDSFLRTIHACFMYLFFSAIPLTLSCTSL